MLSLGEKYDIDVEMISKPREEYSNEEYTKFGFPVAPAIMVGKEIVVEKSDISEKELESVICKHVGLSPSEPQKKGILGRLLNRS
jgi:hypothetical protein